MSDQTEGTTTPSSPVSLRCSAIVYRLLTKQDWIDPDSDQAQPAAFYRRYDEDGLSLLITDACTLDEAINSMKKVKGVATLHVGRIRDLGLEVRPDPTDYKHAEIFGVPLKTEDQERADYLADMLSGQSRICWRREQTTR